jgi:hypothetical protein
MMIIQNTKHIEQVSKKVYQQKTKIPNGFCHQKKTTDHRGDTKNDRQNNNV